MANKGKKRLANAEPRLGASKRLAVQYDTDEDGDDEPEDEAKIEAQIPFCCAVCTCSERRKARVIGNHDVFTPAENELWHRRCCHGNFKEVDPEFCTPYLAAREEAANSEDFAKPLQDDPNAAELFDINDFQLKYEALMQQQKQVVDDSQCFGTHTWFVRARSLYN
jgi:hypothetical protein